MSEGKFRANMKMIHFDHGIGGYQDTDPVAVGSKWETKYNTLCDVSDIVDILGKIKLDNT